MQASWFWNMTILTVTPSYGCKILNIALNKLNLVPNDCKFDADSKYGLEKPRKTILEGGVEKLNLYI